MRATIIILTIVNAMLSSVSGANALEAAAVPLNEKVVELGTLLQRPSGRSDRIQVSTAPDNDGIVRRIEVRARDPENVAGWAVFALSNTSDEQVDRLIVAPRYRLVDSGLVWPDLGSSRITAITPSEGFTPQRVPDTQADVFRLTLDPGATITLVAELRSGNVPELRLWQPQAYEEAVASTALYRGIVLGVAGLLALFLTVLFVVRGTAMFPAAAVLSWSVLGYIAIDFGFWQRVLRVDAALEPVLRAAVEVMLAAAVVVFLYTYLHLHRRHIRYSHVTGIWLLGLVVLGGVIAFDPAIAAGIARLALGAATLVGLALISVLAVRGFDRAIMLIPAWSVLTAWVAAASLAAFGHLDNAVVQPALAGGLVLIVLLIAFTVMQHAFSGDGFGQAMSGEAERRALALAGAGHSLWDWNVSRDKIEIGRDIAEKLGFEPGVPDRPASDWLALVHPADRDQLEAALDAVVNSGRGRIHQVVRARARDGQMHWLRVLARPVLGMDGEVIRCIGTIEDVSEQKAAEERLLHDGVHDNLTGLPNRQLFLDRLGAAITRAETEGTRMPTVLLLDVDRFKQVNDAFGLVAGDAILLAMARRLARMLKAQDTLARIEADRFAVLLLSQSDQVKVNALARELLSAVRTPFSLAERDVKVAASLGIAAPDGRTNAEQLLKRAETAMYHAKRFGGDRLETFRGTMARTSSRRGTIEADLGPAMESEAIDILYQPIVRLDDRMVAGFEALTRWDHPKFGPLSPSEFVGVAEESELIVRLGNYVLERAARALAEWQRPFRGEMFPFVSVNVSSRQLLRHDLIDDVKAVLARTGVEPETLKLEVTETLVMQNPELAAQVLEKIKALGAGLSLDDFGTGYSSLSYLQRFPFDTIKIDRSFVRSNQSRTSSVILRAMVGMVHDLGLKVVAEGAESESDVEELERLGCEYVQGFIYGKPMTAGMVREILRAREPLAATG